MASYRYTRSKACEACGASFFPCHPWNRACSKSCGGTLRGIAGFWSKVNKAGPIAPHMESPCWLWSGRRNAKGYGQFNGYRAAHRRAWELTYGPVPADLFVLHRCDNPPCVRPDHLFLGTHTDNMRDTVMKGRRKGKLAGHRNPAAKLNAAAVMEVRRLYGTVPARELAERFRIATVSVYRVATGGSWRHLPGASRHPQSRWRKQGSEPLRAP